METLLIPITANVIAGIILYILTQQAGNSGGQSVFLIEQAFFNTSPSTDTPKTGEDDPGRKELAFLLLFACLVVAGVVVGIYVQLLDLILRINFAAIVGIAIASILLLIAGIDRIKAVRDWSMVQVSLYFMMMCLAFSSLLWLIYTHPHAPSEYNEAYSALQTINFQPDNWAWIQDVINVVLNYPRAILFLLLQLIGVLTTFVSMVIVVYEQISVAKAWVTGEQGCLSLKAMVVASALVGIAALFVGILR